MGDLPGSTDFLLVGGGVMGLSVALALRQRFTDASITLIEKEAATGLHASGRNSGVIHAGFYYSADSLKARFTVQGNRLMTAYCEAHKITMNRCGKVVVARNEEDLETLDELFRRAASNGVPVEPVDAQQLAEIEPRARCYERGLFSPTTCSVNPNEVMQALRADALESGIRICTNTAYQGRKTDLVMTSQGEIQAGYLVNCAGLYADQIARDYGFAEDYQMLPFKGLYLYSSEPAAAFRCHIYPVPDLQQPFLGVHLTLTVDGRVKIGPTAIPALWREHYQGLQGLNRKELFETLATLSRLWLKNSFGFRKLAWEELKKADSQTLVREAARLASGIRAEDFPVRGQPGIRAQLYDRREEKLVSDFRYECDEHSFHLLNAVSPAFTCSLSLAAYLADQIQSALN